MVFATKHLILIPLRLSQLVLIVGCECSEASNIVVVLGVTKLGLLLAVLSKNSGRQ